MKKRSVKFLIFSNCLGLTLVFSVFFLISCSTEELEIALPEVSDINRAKNNPYTKLRLQDTKWRLQLPVAKSNATKCPGKNYKKGIVSIRNEDIKTTNNNYFKNVENGNAKEFMTPGKSPVTSCGISSVRTELRQTEEWKTNGDNLRTLKIKVKITQFSESGNIAFTQIHSGSDDFLGLVARRTSSNSDRFYIKIVGDGVKRGRDKIDESGYVISGTTGERLKYRIGRAYEFIVSSGNGRIKVQIKNSRGNFYTLYDEPNVGNSNTAHFKAGTYVVGNGNGNGQKGGIAKARFYKIDYDN